MMQKQMRELLVQNPLSYNELLDLFEDYVATIGPPILQGNAMLREEIGGGEHTALGHIFGVACDAEDMAKRLKQIRAGHNKGSEITIPLTRGDALRLEHALDETDRLFSAVANAFELLHAMTDTDTDGDHKAHAVITLARRTLSGLEDRELAELRRLSVRLGEARQYQQFAQEESA